MSCPERNVKPRIAQITRISIHVIRVIRGLNDFVFRHLDGYGLSLAGMGISLPESAALKAHFFT